MKTKLNCGAFNKRIPVIAKGLDIGPTFKLMRFLIPVHLLAVGRLLLTSGALMAALTGSVAAGSTPWAVIKCKFSDQPQEPAFNPAFITSTYGMAGYWSGVSYGQISLTGTAVFGWYTLPFTAAQGTNMSRGAIVAACIAAASDVNVSQYFSVMAVVNANMPSGNSGAVGHNVLLEPWAWIDSFAEHEMGHVYGLNHSYDDSGIDYGCPNSCYNDPGVYGDGWDIMSAMTFGNSNPTFTGVYGASGPGLIAPNIDKLGWLPANRVLTWDGTSETVTLAALNRPLVSGYLMVKVPIDAANPNHYYTIEFRRKTDWDQGIPQNTVLIHEVRPNGLFYLVRTNGGPQRLPNQTFRDTNNNVAITVLNIDDNLATATVNIGMNEVWVDFNWGTPNSGTFAAPYKTLADGVTHVSYGGNLYFKTGSSHETRTIVTPMVLKAYNGAVIIGH